MSAICWCRHLDCHCGTARRIRQPCHAQAGSQAGQSQACRLLSLPLLPQWWCIQCDDAHQAAMPCYLTLEAKLPHLALHADLMAPLLLPPPVQAAVLEGRAPGGPLHFP